jgi:hypothetical protein
LKDTITDDLREVDILITTKNADYIIKIDIEVFDQSRKADVPCYPFERKKEKKRDSGAYEI